MAKSTAYKLLVFVDELWDSHDDMSYIEALDDILCHIREQYPEDFKQYNEEKEKETA